ncbi:MAG: hypothetical protein HYT80_11165 [Euryarchaeota archaeon]|nr:hypothetical protein [Euryarchaeota archaeon]
MRHELNLARGRVGDNSQENWVIMFTMMGRWPDNLIAYHEEGGFTAPRLDLLHWKSTIRPAAVPQDWEAYMALVVAYGTDATAELQRHIEDRYGAEANFFALITGFTGSGKSSCAVTLMRFIRHLSKRPLAPDDVKKFVAFDQAQLGPILQRCVRGDVVILDEELRTSGEGSRTRAMTALNVENTLRATGVSMIICSPEVSEHVAAQIELRAFLYNRETKRTKFMMYKKGVPIGYVDLAWCLPQDYAVYKAIKQGNLARTLRMQFQPDDLLYEAIMERMFTNPRFCGFIDKLNKVKKNLLLAAVSNMSSRLQLTETQQKKAVDLCIAMMEVYPRVTDAEWLEVWGRAPAPEFARIAKKFYLEAEMASTPG